LEEELRRSEAKFRRIVENANDTIATITPEGIITYLSPNMLKMIGREATEVIGTSFEPLVHPDDLPMIGSLLQEGFTTGKPFTTEYRLRDRDGNYRYLVANSSVYYDENSNPMVLGISRDVTKQKRLEEELRQSEYKFRAIVENANDLIYVIDANGRILYMSPNSAAINGFNPEEMEGRTFDRFVHPDDLVVGADAIGRAIAGEKFSFELRSFHKDGSIRWFSSNISPFSLADGTRVMMGIGRDTTERKQREEELRLAKDAAEAANRSKSTFLANMSHELRTPLNVILGYTQLMERENALSDRQRNFITTINRSGEHLLNLINDVLEMSKIEAGRITLNPEPFDLRHLLDTLQSMFRIRTEAKKLSLNFHVPSNLPTTILTDEGKLRQVLINLLSNAVKFTEQGSITLHVEMINTVTSHQTSDLTAEANPTPHSPTILFTITDTGIGIAPTEIEQLFQPFVQTASGLRVKEGTGLGLTISRQFVQLMGGEIQVQSLVGQGSTFTFQIPVTLTERTVAPAPTRRFQPVLGLLPGQPTYRLLIVDDRVDNRNLLTHLLQPLGFVTQTANNGQEAITLWRTWQPDLIWMDMRMPVMNGYEATRQIRALEQNQTSDASQDIQTPRLTKIIALTASAFEEQRATILAAGCDDFVRKPFREHLIFDKLTEHLGVQFVYAEPVEEPDWRMAEPADLLPDSFAVMSPEWIEAFRQAAIAIDSDRLLQLVVEIPPDHANLANQLRDLINRFNFDEILELIGDTCDA